MVTQCSRSSSSCGRLSVGLGTTREIQSWFPPVAFMVYSAFAEKRRERQKTLLQIFLQQA
jgi:hypothetical protein